MIFKEKIKYLGGWELDFENDEAASAFLLTHGVDKKGFQFFKDIQEAIELRIEGDKISKFYSHSGMWKELKGENIELPVDEWEEHQVFFLKKSNSGNHVLGGKKPDDLVLPSSENLKTPFQYIGTIDGTDPLFKWMGIPKLHIIYPIYECNRGVYLDYSNPLKPRIISETFNSAWYEPDMGNVGIIEFSETKYETVEELDSANFEDSDDVLLCGVPLWHQSPEVPLCPITHKVMKFVCTVNSDRNIEIMNKQMSKGLPFSDEYLCFGDYGHLYIFFEPESKVLHANWQW